VKEKKRRRKKGAKKKKEKKKENSSRKSQYTGRDFVERIIGVKTRSSTQRQKWSLFSRRGSGIGVVGHGPEDHEPRYR